jgi:outer membrane biosynthesis protein TonB
MKHWAESQWAKQSPAFRKWLKVSGAVHAVMLLVIVFGLPTFLSPTEPVVPRLIPVDIVDISEVTNTRIAEKDEPKPQPTPQSAPPEKPTPRPDTPKPDDKPTPPKEAAKTNAPAPDEKAEVIPDKTKPKEKEKPKDEKKPDESKEKKKDEPQKNALASVLKNVAKLKDDIKPQPVVPNAPPAEKAINVPDTPALAQQLSISEMDALRRQIQQCWNVPIGARGIENMNVEIYIEVNEDRTVRRAEVVDTLRMTTDTHFRTVAESARRALFNPRCIPLMLPPDGYNQWNKIRMVFNPAEML